MVPHSAFQIVGAAIVANFKAARVWTEPRHFVKRAKGGADIQDQEGADCLGVSLRSDRASAELAVRVTVLGFTPVEAGGPVREGDEIISDKHGRAITNPQIPGSIVQIQGIARSSGVEGKAIQLEIRKYRVAHPGGAATARAIGGGQ